MKNIFEDFKMIEPLKKNRFLIHFENVDIPYTSFRDFEFYNQGEDIIFETSIWETVHYTFNPLDVFKILGVKIEYLSPIGDVVGGLSFDVKASNFEKNGSYSSDEIMSVKFKFVIENSTLKPLFLKNE